MQSTREQAPVNDVKPSITALAVAMGFMRALDTDYHYLVSQQELDLAKHFFYEGKKSIPFGLNWVLTAALSHLPYRGQQSFFNAAVARGYDHIILLRKLMIKNKIECAIRDGVEQVVYLGSGFDIRSLVASLYHPEVNFYELDRGPTRESKLQCLRSIPASFNLNLQIISRLQDNAITTVNHNLFMIECDLALRDIRDVLCSFGFDPSLKTLIIAEGLTPYLSSADNRKMLASMFGLFKQGDELLLSYMSDLVSSAIQNKAVEESNEQQYFPLAPNAVIPFTAEFGFEVTKHFAANDFLGVLGENEEAEFYRNNRDKPKEIYYLLTKPSVTPDPTRKMSDVPMMDCPLAANQPWWKRMRLSVRFYRFMM